jgi:glycosyltransferase involved in cell wall biosynthesis
MITVVTAAWRAEGLKTVIECLDKQTIHDFHHIIVNDNNPDVRRYLRANNYFEEDLRRHVIDNRIRLHYYGGPSRNIGVQASFVYLRERDRSDNEWICFLDDDNLAYPVFLETFEQMQSERPDATLLGVDMEMRSKQNPAFKSIRECEVKPQKCDLGNFCYKRSLFDKYGYFQARPDKKFKFDYELIEKMARGEGEDSIYIKHVPTWIFYTKKLK